MDRDHVVTAGAFALYRSENAHRIGEFEKTANSNELIARDFAQFKGRYTRMFQDLCACLEAEGLAVRQIA